METPESIRIKKSTNTFNFESLTDGYKMPPTSLTIKTILNICGIQASSLHLTLVFVAYWTWIGCDVTNEAQENASALQ